MKTTLRFLFLVLIVIAPAGFSSVGLTPPISLPGGKHQLMKFDFDVSASKALRQRVKQTLHMQSGSLPSSVQLGMNGVPALNQGVHGTCVTFAISAALDALLGLGDHISQLCFLAHGKYLYSQTGWPSGWNGAWGKLIISRFLQHGYVSRDKQLSQGCGGLYEYPGGERNNTGGMMRTAEYALMSQPLPDVIWRERLTLQDALKSEFNASWILEKVKESLSHGDRVLLTYLLDVVVKRAGAAGQHVKPHDSYIMTEEIAEHMRQGQVRYGHYVIITGYDDFAEASGHRGLFKIRLSWGPYAGDHGDYYMSYDYFSKMLLEVSSLETNQSSN